MDVLYLGRKPERPTSRDVTAQVVKTMFPEKLSGKNVERYLPIVLRELERVGLSAPELVLYALATIRAESAGFQPLDEAMNTINTPWIAQYPDARFQQVLVDLDGRVMPTGWRRDEPFGKYERMLQLGNTETGDGQRYRGRGFVQLTGRHNYEKYGRKLGLDLVGHPELASTPEIAARLLAAYVLEHRSAILAALEKLDFKKARKAVNGGSHGLERFIDAYWAGYSAIFSASPRKVRYLPGVLA